MINSKKIKNYLRYQLKDTPLNLILDKKFLIDKLDQVETIKENDILLPSLEVIQKYPIESMMETLKVNVIPEKSLNKNIQLLFTFTDSPKSFSLFLRRGVLEVQPFMITGSSVQIKSSENDLKAILSGVKSLPISLVNGTLKVEGSRADLLSFFSSLRN